MTLLAMLIRGLLTLAVLWLLLRLTGKRGLRALGPLDLLIAVMMGNLAHALVYSQVSLPEGFVGLGMLLWVHLTIGMLMQRAPRLRARVQGLPTVLVSRGTLFLTALARAGITRRQFSWLLREAGAERLRDVESMHIDADGTLMMQSTAEARPLRRGDLPVPAAIDDGEEPEPWLRAA